MSRVLPGTDEFNQVINRAASLRDTAKAYERLADELLDGLDLDPSDYRQYPAGLYILDVAENKRFDAATAKRNLPVGVYNSILVETPNSDRARDMLSREDYRLCQRTYDKPKRSIVRVEDED